MPRRAQPEHHRASRGKFVVPCKFGQGYLAIRCENTFSGVVALDEENNLLTTKTASADHGYGLIQMRRIAAKYGSTLSVSYNAERFTVMTALKLP